MHGSGFCSSLKNFWKAFFCLIWDASRPNWLELAGTGRRKRAGAGARYSWRRNTQTPSTRTNLPTDHHTPEMSATTLVKTSD
eukprot:COSAG04_NODE_4143_length_2273_cov_1.343146_3_plen_81_part_01